MVRFHLHIVLPVVAVLEGQVNLLQTLAMLDVVEMEEHLLLHMDQQIHKFMLVVAVVALHHMVVTRELHLAMVAVVVPLEVLANIRLVVEEEDMMRQLLFMVPSVMADLEL